MYPHDATPERVLRLQPKGFILSGGPASVYEPSAPRIPDYLLEQDLPILGICYGMQLLTQTLGGVVAAASEREYGPAEVKLTQRNPLLNHKTQQVWMSHGDQVEVPPPGFEVLAESANCPISAMGNMDAQWYGVQFHPEVHHTTYGEEILQTFVTEICGARPDWRATPIIDQSIAEIQNQVGGERVIAAVSGGVDSTVAASLVHRAIGDQLTCIFVNNGLMRRGEPQRVIELFRGQLGAELIAVDATETFLDALENITDPEEKRKVIGELFIRTFEEHTAQIGGARYLVQGTIYPDVIESSSPEQAADRIKTHHNVGGLPTDLKFELVEPLRYLFKDEVREVGIQLGIDPSVVWRQPFPGPGLAVRCLGAVTHERLERLRIADSILIEELESAGIPFAVNPRKDAVIDPPAVSQAFAVLLPIRSVGVMGDQRTYHETVVIRAVTTDDFMTADWARLPPDTLARISSRIVNEVPLVSRVAYDITSKPPATIEWE
jgi:GMP synthase (glutamine-hydrolysing)